MIEPIAFYTGEVVHVRGGDITHRLRHRVEMVLVDTERLDEATPPSRWWGSSGQRPVRLAREDLLGDPDVPLLDEVRRVVAEGTDQIATGPVAVLTAPRFLGVGFNPIRCYFCFDPKGNEVEHLVLEVTNTPWGERHVYLVGPPGRYDIAKEFHVSPFLPLAMRYELRYVQPGERIVVTLHARALDDGPELRAVLSLRRRPSGRRAFSAPLRRPWRTTIGSSAAIYAHALLLVARRAPFFPHPRQSMREVSE